VPRLRRVSNPHGRQSKATRKTSGLVRKQRGRDLSYNFDELRRKFPPGKNLRGLTKKTKEEERFLVVPLLGMTFARPA
jgi:hypothetical protein